MLNAAEFRRDTSAAGMAIEAAAAEPGSKWWVPTSTKSTAADCIHYRGTADLTKKGKEDDAHTILIKRKKLFDQANGKRWTVCPYSASSHRIRFKTKEGPLEFELQVAIIVGGDDGVAASYELHSLKQVTRYARFEACAPSAISAEWCVCDPSASSIEL